MEKLYLRTLIYDCTCPEDFLICPKDFLDCPEEDIKYWDMESGKAVFYFELIEDKGDMEYMEDMELFDYGCVHLDDLPREVWEEYCYDEKIEAVINFIKEIYPSYEICT